MHVVAPPAVDAAVDAAVEDEPPLDPKEAAQQEIVDALNGLFATSGVKNTIATSSEDDLMILAPKGDCDRKVLADLRKGLAAMKLDPKNAFATMQCNGGPLLRLR